MSEKFRTSSLPKGGLAGLPDSACQSWKAGVPYHSGESKDSVRMNAPSAVYSARAIRSGVPEGWMRNIGVSGCIQFHATASSQRPATTISERVG